MLVVSALLFVLFQLPFEFVNDQINEGKRIRARLTAHEGLLLINPDYHLRGELVSLVIQHQFDLMYTIVEPRQLARLLLGIIANVIGNLDMPSSYANIHRSILQIYSDRPVSPVGGHQKPA